MIGQQERAAKGVLHRATADIMRLREETLGDCHSIPASEFIHSVAQRRRCWDGTHSTRHSGNSLSGALASAEQCEDSARQTNTENKMTHQRNVAQSHVSNKPIGNDLPKSDANATIAADVTATTTSVVAAAAATAATAADQRCENTLQAVTMRGHSYKLLQKNRALQAPQHKIPPQKSAQRPLLQVVLPTV